MRTALLLTASLAAFSAPVARAAVTLVPSISEASGAANVLILPSGERPDAFVSDLTRILASPAVLSAPHSEAATVPLALAESIVAPAGLARLGEILSASSIKPTPKVAARVVKNVMKAQEASPENLRRLIEAADALRAARSESELRGLYDGSGNAGAVQETEAVSAVAAASGLGAATPKKGSGCPFHFLWGGAPPPAPVGATVEPARLSFLRFSWWALRSLGDPLGVLVRIHERFGDKPVEVRFPTGHRFLFTHDPTVMMRVLSKTTERPDAAFGKSRLQSRPLARIVGWDNLFLGEGSAWSRNRAHFAPLFTPGRMHSERTYRGMLKTMDSSIARLERRAKASHDGVAELDLPRDAARMTLDALLRQLFRTELGDAELEELGDAYAVATSWLSREAANPLPFGLDRLPALSPGRRKLRRAYATIDAYAARILDDHRPAGAGEQADFIDLLKTAKDEAGNPIGRDESLSQIKTMLLAGHETTATLLSWTFYSLAADPRVKERLVGEIDRVLDGRRDVWPDDLRAMPYLDAVLSESLRLYSPAYVIARRVDADEKVGTEGGLVRVEKGTTVIMTPFMTHRRERQWGRAVTGHEAEEFAPERFLKEAVLGDDSSNDLRTFAFGAGPRVCIGMTFALVEAKLALIRHLQEFELLPHAGRVARGSDISVKIVGGVKLRLKPRADILE